MSVKVKVSEVIGRPVSEVFHFYAHEHVRNHPRWDPYMHLEQTSHGPIGVGTIISRINSRSGTPVEGTMEVVEFEPNQSLGMIIHDGPVEIQGRAIFEAKSSDQTTLTLNVEFPDMEESMDTSLLAGPMQQSLQNIKRLIESEI
jgi:hypothetical protein